MRKSWGIVIILGAICGALFAPVDVSSQTSVSKPAAGAKAGPKKEADQGANAKAPESLLPAKSVAYMRYDGGALHQAAWKKTAFYESFEASGLRAVIERLVKSGLAQSNFPAAEFAGAAFETVTNHGLSLAVWLSDEGLPMPAGAIVFHRGAVLEAGLVRNLPELMPDAEIKEAMLSGRTVRRIPLPDTPGLTADIWTEGPHLVVAVGQGAAESVIATAAGEEKSLAGSELLKSLATVAGHEVTTVGWLDFEAIRERVAGISVPTRDPNRPVKVGEILNAAGLNGLQRVTFRSGFF